MGISKLGIWAMGLALALALAIAPAWAQESRPRSITVVMDDNYPPFIFRDHDGALAGILKDSWELWSQKTGVAVNLRAMDWGLALKEMAEGRADVIDTIFQTEPRQKVMDFSPPYATLEVPIWFQKDLSGIAGAGTLKGFTVGVKDGDACLDWLQARGLGDFRRYPSYESMVDAAARRELLVFCIDKPPAAYFMMKRNVMEQFRHSEPLYSGQFHRAVRKGDAAMLALVNEGFTRITPHERDAIEARWLGSPLKLFGADGLMARFLPWLLGAAALGLVLMAWNWQLHRQVTSRTRRLAESESRFRTIFDSVNDAIFIHDIATGAILFVNGRAREMFLLGDHDVSTIGIRDISEGTRPYSRSDARAWMAKAAQGQPQLFEWHARRLDGTLFWSEVNMRRAVLDGADRLLVVVRDISERKSARARLEFLAHHDPLTLLPNRLLLADRVGHAIARAERNRETIALLFLDMDQFKQVNDSLGHAAGDSLLKELARRLVSSVRESDTVTRQGGDEFIILLDRVGDTDEVVEIVARIQDSLVEPMRVDGHEISTSLSIGIALYPGDGDDFDTLLKKADTAMYQAKESGRNTHRFFSEEMNANALRHLTVRSGLRRALDQGEFVLHYQPQFDVATGRPVGAEALIRWNHPERGLVPPAEFIPIAEDSGLIIPMGEWVLHQACRQAARWHRDGHPLTVAVNLSALQFRRTGLERIVAGALRESGLPAHLLELELTESILVQNADGALAVANRLAEMGVQLSIDDFGTGYSSLAYIKRLAVHRLKIDQSFVRDMDVNPESQAIVSAVIRMARGLNLSTVAEGVETEAVLAHLGELGCDIAQGYLLGRPAPAEEFLLARA